MDADSATMPKPNKNAHLLYKWQADIGEDCFQPWNGNMYCQLCAKMIPCSRRSQLLLHLRSAGHKESAEARKREREQQQRRDSDCFVDAVGAGDELDLEDDDDNFHLELCAALCAVQMPLRVLSNGHFNAFLSHYMRRAIPDGESLALAILSK